MILIQAYQIYLMLKYLGTPSLQRAEDEKNYLYLDQTWIIFGITRVSSRLN